ncbi:MAG: metal-sensing transcriptional repressor [Ornithinibacter sp.]
MTTRPGEPAAAAERDAAAAGALAAAVAGLGLAREQIGDVVAMLENDGGCAEVVTALAEISTAVDRAGFAVIAAGLRECMVRPARQGAADAATLERLFLSLA